MTDMPNGDSMLSGSYRSSRVRVTWRTLSRESLNSCNNDYADYADGRGSLPVARESSPPGAVSA